MLLSRRSFRHVIKYFAHECFMVLRQDDNLFEGALESVFILRSVFASVCRPDDHRNHLRISILDLLMSKLKIDAPGHFETRVGPEISQTRWYTSPTVEDIGIIPRWAPGLPIQENPGNLSYLSDWQATTMVPIRKKDSKHYHINYKHVSLTSIAYKIMKLFVRDSIQLHLIRNSSHESALHSGGLFIPT